MYNYPKPLLKGHPHSPCPPRPTGERSFGGLKKTDKEKQNRTRDKIHNNKQYKLKQKIFFSWKLFTMDFLFGWFFVKTPPTKQNPETKDLTFWGFGFNPPTCHACAEATGQLLGVRLATKASFLHRILGSKLENSGTSNDEENTHLNNKGLWDSLRGLWRDLWDLLGIYGMKLTYPLKMDGWKMIHFLL